MSNALGCLGSSSSSVGSAGSSARSSSAGFTILVGESGLFGNDDVEIGQRE